MNVKRRDNRRRVLRDGEYQCKDGRYKYVFTKNGVSKAFYSWKLERTDKLPAGKRDCVALRDKIAELKKEQEKGVAYHADGMTVFELVDRYTALKPNVKHTTKTGYKTVMNILEKEDFAARRIDTIKTSEAKEFLIKMQQKDHRSYSTIATVRGVVRPAFAMAVEDDLIVKNPFDFMLVDVLVNDSVRREAITAKQMRQFLAFVEQDNHFSKYYEAIYILFHTGMRISEFCGLTISDIDMEERTISIDHQLQRTSDMEYIIVPSAKTDAGTRVLPMEDDVYECFRKLLANRKKPKIEPMIDGYAGFLYLDANENPTVALHWEHYFKHICQKYNKLYRAQMPNVTPHVCRHTYCSIKAKAGMNPNTLKYLMGHSDISVTLNTYTHIAEEDAKEEMVKLKLIKKNAV